MIDAESVAAVLDGIEGTIEELMARVDVGSFRERLSELHTATAATRRFFEEAWNADAADQSSSAACHELE